MKATERFIVKKVVRFGMLFGYVVYDTIEKKNTPYEYDERTEYWRRIFNGFKTLN